MPSPGRKLLEAFRKEFGDDLPIIAEDLGVITPDVEALRDENNLPGMKILQFAFSVDESDGEIDAANAYLPHNVDENSVIYTGTHDNDTTLGWYKSQSDKMKDIVRRYFECSDEDIVYEPGYAEKIVKEFERNPKAHMILFHIQVEEERRTYQITERKRVRWYNCGRYGAVSFAVKRESLLCSGVAFSLLFGGGARYSAGEDSLFLREFMKKGFLVYTAPVTIGRERERESTWFSGYHQKFFYDRGVLYHFLYGRLALGMALRFLLAHKGTLCRETSLKQAFVWMREGIRDAKAQ